MVRYQPNETKTKSVVYIGSELGRFIWNVYGKTRQKNVFEKKII